MAYSDLQLNQTVSFNNLQSGVTQGYFVAKTTIPVSAKQITKTEANTYVNINTALPSYAAKASNQLVTRDNLQGATDVFPYTMYSASSPLGVSIDGGNTFTSYTWTHSALLSPRIAGDVTRTYVAVVDRALNKQIYISNNSGATFSAVSLSSSDFYPYDVSMSTNGQYIAVTGLSRYDPVYPYNDAPVYFRIAISSNYGASFADYTSPSSYVVGSVAGYCLYPISVSGNGQYITAVFGYNEYQGAPYNYQRHSNIVFKSNNYGASWTQDIFNNALFQGIALSGTGQYQFVTGYWSKRFIVGPAEIGIKGYISNDYGANWTQKFEDYNSNIGGINYNNLSLVGISDNGSSMVAATGRGSFADNPTDTDIRYASSDYGANFTTYLGVGQGLHQYSMAVSQYILSGITNSYVALFAGSNQLCYSTDGGKNNWFFKQISNFAPMVYNKALNTPALSYSYTLYYNTTTVLPTVTGFNTAIDACDLSTNSFVVYSNSSTVGIGMKLYYDIYGITPIVANPSTGSNTYYRINGNSVQFGSDGYTINSVAACASFITYYADEYVCDGIDCTYVQSNVLVALPDSFTPDYTKYYLLQAGGPRIFFLDTTTTGVGLILSTTNYNSCLEICGV